MMADAWQTGTAIYAAIVATGALFLEVRRWFEDKPRLAIRVATQQQLFNVAGYANREFLIVTVSNRGKRPTTITNLWLFEYANVIQRIRRHHRKAAVVAVPEIPGTGMRTPYSIEPGREWMGMVDRNEGLVDWLATGRLYVGILTSHQDRAIVKFAGNE
jgi:hypothetical protein